MHGVAWCWNSPSMLRKIPTGDLHKGMEQDLEWHMEDGREPC